MVTFTPPPVATTARKAQAAAVIGFFGPLLAVAIPCSEAATATGCVGSMQTGTLLLNQTLALVGLAASPDPAMVGAALNALIAACVTSAVSFAVTWLASNKPKA
jgi:hypothetical protein